MRAAKWSKYGAKKTVVDGITFPSKLEARRWCELQTLQKSGTISGLKRQVPFDLKVNGHLICRYIADFTYIQTTTGENVVEDAKGVMTPAFRLKAKLMEAIHGIVVQAWTGKPKWGLDVVKGRWLRGTRTASSRRTSKGSGALRSSS